MSFLKELVATHGKTSAMRVMSLICVVVACILAIIGLLRKEVDYSGLSLLCGTFLSAGFAGKVVQKNIESKS